jgi:NADPH:quinone reductase-like Zn-dependent oxidoreductase
MKAAVMYQKGGLPEYADITEPTIQDDDQLLINVKAVAIKHFDRGRAAGTHYSSEAHREGGKVIGGDAVGLLADGTRVYALGDGGTMAEKALVHKQTVVKVPGELDDATAAALPNAVIGAAMGLKFKAQITPGDVVLVNGATGFTGQVAVQIAKHYGAKKVIATGRNAEALEHLRTLGADETISLLQDDESILAQLKKIHAGTPVDIVIDYLWGHSAELIMDLLKGDGSFTNRRRYVSVGAMSGADIRLAAEVLRSTNFELSGSGLGAWTRQQVGELIGHILPEMFALAVEGKLKVETMTVKLEDIAELWHIDVPGGKRLVVEL